jgi:hypothetical protein
MPPWEKKLVYRLPHKNNAFVSVMTKPFLLPHRTSLSNAFEKA